MKRFIPTIVACLLAFVPGQALRAKTPASALKVYDMEVAVDDQMRQLSVDIDLRLSEIRLGRDRETIFTPVVISVDGSESVSLPSIIVAGRNRWYWYLRNGGLVTDSRRVYRAGQDQQHVTLSQTIPFEDWMGDCTVEMRESSGNCCATPRPVPGPSEHGMIEMARISTARPALLDEFVFAPPVNAGPVIKELSGSAFITFVVNRTELKPDYMINRAELAKIINSIDFVRQDSDATITHVHIKGFASPEGPYDNNVRLAKGRTETLRRYVRDLYHFADTTITSSYEPEDWAGLSCYLRDSMDYKIDHRAEILEIIDSPLGFDAKDHTIRQRFPQDYAVILKQIYPWLRHSDYTVRYSIRTYTSVDEIRRVYDVDPTRLRNVDFYTLAQSYPEGSPEYCAVFEKAVEVYPDDPGSNLNAANIEMKRGNYDRAQSHLLRAGRTPEADFARGVLAARRGDYGEALRLFSIAAEAGVPHANEYIDNVSAMRDYHPVTYSIERSRTTETEK
ncbi:MAG: DUF3868 domain-containing protein [Muribaculaceae bacterium]|nr:DUF3868 domain-containing protein [Muribaculaceae bacterium]